MLVFFSFLPRDATTQSAVMPHSIHVVRPSVCPSVTLVDQDHIGWKSWKLIARSISPTPSLFVAQKPSPPPTASPSPRLGVHNPPQKCNRYYLRNG